LISHWICFLFVDLKTSAYQ